MFHMHELIYIAIALLVLLVLVVSIVKKRFASTQSFDGGQLYIGNLSYQMNNHHLREIFSRYGEITDVRVIKNARTGRSKGFAFITYTNQKDAEKALEAHGETVWGRSIVVRIAKQKPRE